MKKTILTGTLLATVILMAVSGYAATNEADWGQYSKITLKPALLTGQIKSDLPRGKMQLLYQKMELKRFDIFRESNPNTPALLQWCDNAVKDMQTIREETYEEGDVKMKLKAKIERCSQLFRHDLSVRHRCEVKSSRDSEGHVTHYVECKVFGKLTFVKFRGDQSTGKFRFVSDPNFEHNGRAVIRSKGVGTCNINRNTSRRKAHEVALTAAVKKCGFHFMKPIREIKNFQIHAPIIGVKGSTTFSCLGKDTVELDMPFYVVFLGGTKERRVGFVKARKIHDGCVETPSLKKKWARGAKKDLHPMEAQIILGKAKVKPGKTIWEMPTSYLNIGLGLGITNLGKGMGIKKFGSGSYNLHPAAEVTLDQDIARKIGVPEVYVTETVRFTYVKKGDAFQFNNNFRRSYPNSGIIPDSWFAIQTDIGLLKRWFAGPFFFGLGGNLALSYYIGLGAKIGSTSKTPIVIGIGAGARIELGFQLAPRWLMALRLGYRFEYGIPYLKNGGSKSDKMGLGQGVLGALGLMYTY